MNAARLKDCSPVVCVPNTSTVVLLVVAGQMAATRYARMSHVFGALLAVP